MDWSTQAKLLRIGQSKKVVHCGKDPSAYIGNTDYGVRLYCMRCGDKEFIPHDARSLSEILATRRVAEEQAFKSATIPKDSVSVREASSLGMVWLLKAGITPEKATSDYGIRWHPPTHRMLIPIRENDASSKGYVARSVDGTKPKYIFRGQGNIWHSPDTTPELCVVCEDILSAIAINKAGYTSNGVLGTSITHSQSTVLARWPVIVGWFDSDAAGDKGWVRLRKAMNLSDSKVIRVDYKGKDPKYLSRAAIQEVIENAKLKLER